MVGSKPWYMSKGMWAALLTGLIGTWMSVDASLGGALPDIPGPVILVLGALGLYGRKSATTVIE